MQPNKTMPNDIDALINERLAERGRKADLVARWQREDAAKKAIKPWSMKKKILTGLSAAAAIVVICSVATTLLILPVNPIDRLGIEAPVFETFRGVDSTLDSINSLISQAKYAQALPLIKNELSLSDCELADIASKAFSGDESAAYDYELTLMQNNDLRWAYIYVLTRTKRFKEAKAELKIYQANQDIITGREDADKLMVELEKM